MGGAYAFPDDESRLQGGACGDDLSRWEFLTDQGGDNFRAKPADAVQASWDLAKQEFCFRCPLLERCLERSKTERLGVMGGLDQYERYKARKVAYRTRVRVEKKVIEEPQPAPVTLTVVPAQRVMTRSPFPPENPSFCDGWTRDRTIVRAGWYVSQSPDGACIRMKLKVGGAGIIKWFVAEDVDLRRPVAPVIGHCKHHKHEVEEAREESAEGVSDRLSA